MLTYSLQLNTTESNNHNHPISLMLVEVDQVEVNAALVALVIE
jgi:hypothetical protein